MKIDDVLEKLVPKDEHMENMRYVSSSTRYEIINQTKQSLYKAIEDIVNGCLNWKFTNMDKEKSFIDKQELLEKLKKEMEKT